RRTTPHQAQWPLRSSAADHPAAAGSSRDARRPPEPRRRAGIQESAAREFPSPWQRTRRAHSGWRQSWPKGIFLHASRGTRRIYPLRVPGTMTAKRKTHTPKQKILDRLNRVDGQVRGIARMVEEERYCIDVLTQLQAVRAAIASIEKEMLTTHLSHCFEGAIVSGNTGEQR